MIVVDVGAGSGILSLFAASAGASRVIAVELDPLLARTLRSTVQANGFDEIVEVVEGDIMSSHLPKDVDVVIAEIIDTGLMDEMQIPALLALRRAGVIGSRAQVLPRRYTTSIQLVETSNDYYGFRIFAPKHEWAFYRHGDHSNWHQTDLAVRSEQVVISTLDFVESDLNPVVRSDVRLWVDPGAHVNAIRISASAVLVDGIEVGECNSLNGDKILPIEPFVGEGETSINITYEMGGGLVSFLLKREQPGEGHAW